MCHSSSTDSSTFHPAVASHAGRVFFVCYGSRGGWRPCRLVHCTVLAMLVGRTAALDPPSPPAAWADLFRDEGASYFTGTTSPASFVIILKLYYLIRCRRPSASWFYCNTIPVEHYSYIAVKDDGIPGTQDIMSCELITRR